MFDAKRLLGQFIAGQVGKRLGGGYAPGHTSGHANPLSQLTQGLGGGGGAALAGTLATALLGSKKGRKLGGSAVKAGGLALVGSLAYRAYQDWQAGQTPAAPAATGGGFTQAAWTQAPQTSAARSTGLAPPPVGSAFASADEAAQQDLSRTLLLAMIAAAKADGHIDAKEQAAIFGRLDTLDLDADDKAFVLDALREPVDVDALARGATSPEVAAEIYAASLLAIDVDNPAERGYLALLAARLRLDDGLVAHLHATVARNIGDT